MTGIMNIARNSLQLVSGPLLVPLEDFLQVRQPEYDVISVNEQMRLHFQLEPYSRTPIATRNIES